MPERPDAVAAALRPRHRRHRARARARRGGGHGARHYRAALADGRELFVKSADDAGPLEAEARGLRWLGEAGAVAVPEIIFSMKGLLALAYVREASADRGERGTIRARAGRPAQRRH